MTADWPTEAREAVAEIIREASRRPTNSLAVADAVLAALAPHVQTRTNDAVCQCVVNRLAVLHDGHCCVVTPGSVELRCHQSEVDAYRSLAEAREVLGEIGELVDPWMGFDGAAMDGVKAVITEVKHLRAAVQPRTDDWEWGTRDDGGHITNVGDDEFTARTWVKDFPQETLIRRHAATDWEVAP